MHSSNHLVFRHKRSSPKSVSDMSPMHVSGLGRPIIGSTFDFSCGVLRSVVK